MKKILCLILSLVFIFSLTACSDSGEKKKKNNIDIEYYANLGQMPECEYSLSESVSKINEELTKEFESSNIEEMVYNVSEKDNRVQIDNGQYKYFYLKDKEDKGVSYIVNFDTAFGFPIGTLTVEIEDALKDFNYKTEEISKDKVFFLFGSPEGSIIECNFKENTVMFVFENNALCATALYKTSDWIGEQFWKISQ